MYVRNELRCTCGIQSNLSTEGKAQNCRHGRIWLPLRLVALTLKNHLSYADFYLTQHLAVRAGMLGQCRYFAKRELVWMIPLFGWAFWVSFWRIASLLEIQGFCCQAVMQPSSQVSGPR